MGTTCFTSVEQTNSGWWTVAMSGYRENLRGKYKTSEMIWGSMNTFLEEAKFARASQQTAVISSFSFWLFTALVKCLITRSFYPPRCGSGTIHCAFLCAFNVKCEVYVFAETKITRPLKKKRLNVQCEDPICDTYHQKGQYFVYLLAIYI